MIGFGLLALALLLVLFGVWKFFLAPEPGMETPVGQAVTSLLQKNDKGQAIRALREREKNEKPFPLLREKPDMPPLVSPSAINLLIMARDVEANLYDTLLVVSMNPEDGAVRLINVPRDLFVDYSEEAVSRISRKISGINESAALRKINAAHKLGKLIGYREENPRFHSPDYDFTADLLEELLGLSIDDVVFIHHESFRKIVDEFGGVEVEIARGMRYSDPVQKLRINLQPGVQVLNGEDAEGFVRFRKGTDQNGKYYEIGDLGRKENQNAFVKAFMDQHLTLGNVNRIVSLTNRYTEFVETSVVGQVKISQYTQLAKSLIAAKFNIVPITLQTGYQKVLGTSHLVLGNGMENPPKGGGTSKKPVKAETEPDVAADAPDGSDTPAQEVDADPLPEGETGPDASGDSAASETGEMLPDNGEAPPSADSGKSVTPETPSGDPDGTGNPDAGASGGMVPPDSGGEGGTDASGTNGMVGTDPSDGSGSGEAG